MFSVLLSFFFFQAEEGIRDLYVTGVQTCALPICPHRRRARRDPGGRPVARIPASPAAVRTNVRRLILTCRSEERRVGEECRSGGAPQPNKKESRQTERIDCGKVSTSVSPTPHSDW